MEWKDLLEDYWHSPPIKHVFQYEEGQNYKFPKKRLKKKNQLNKLNHSLSSYMHQEA